MTFDQKTEDVLKESEEPQSGPSYDELWNALEQLSSGTVFIGQSKHHISLPDEVYEWIDSIVWKT